MKSPDFSTVILASASPRRRELFSLLGMEFQVIPAEVDEIPFRGETAPDYVLRMAEDKARWIVDRQDATPLVLAADTTVVDHDQILGKPLDAEEAERMLKSLRGRVHLVYSGIVVAWKRELRTDLCRTEVPMRHYSDQEMRAYIASGDPMDKAGAYAIQHKGFHPVEGMSGCFANVMGLPLCHLVRTLGSLGLEICRNVPQTCQDHIGYGCPVYPSILSAFPCD
jgi:MAF protein